MNGMPWKWVRRYLRWRRLANGRRGNATSGVADECPEPEALRSLAVGGFAMDPSDAWRSEGGQRAGAVR